MSTQTGSISFESTGNFSQVVKQNYATLSQIKGQFAVCSTGASTTEKIATTVPTNADWTLYAGATVTVKFTSANTASVPTLNVNNTGPKEIRDYNANELLKAAREWKADAAIAFTYDGTYWRVQDSNLMERVYSAETRIDQNADQISLRATKSMMGDVVRNLLVGGSFPKVKNEQWSETTAIDGDTWYRWSTGTLSKTNGGVRFDSTGDNQGFLIPLVANDCVRVGEQVTLSFTYRGTYTSTGSLWFIAKPSPNANNGNAQSLIADEQWHEFSYSWTVTAGTSPSDAKFHSMLLFYGGSTSGKWIEIKDGTMMLERGNTMYASQAELKITSDAIGLTASGTATIANPNLSPFFESAPYRTSVNYDGQYWQPTTDNWFMSGVTKLDDGWAHVEISSPNHIEITPHWIENIDSSKNYTLLIEWKNVTTTGSSNLYARNYPLSCQFTQNSYHHEWLANSPSNGTDYIKMTVDTTEKTTSWRAAINLGMILGSDVTFSGDLRLSIYEGDYTGPYKPYTGSQLYTSQSEFKVTTDGINSEVSKINSVKYVNTNYSNPLATLKGWAAEGHSDSWTISTDDTIRVGDTVYIKCQDTTRNCPVYIKVKVTAVTSSSRITGISHGYEDVLPVDTIKSTINQSSDAVKIQANHIEIDGTATFKNSDNTTTTLGNYLSNNYDSKGSAAAVQNNLDNLKIGGINLFSWPVTGTKWKDEEHALNNYQNKGSFTQFSGSLLFDPSETLGEQYTISFWAKSPNGTTRLQLYNNNGNPKYFYFGSVVLTTSLGNEWQYFTYTVTNIQYNGTNTPSTDNNIIRRIEIYAPDQMGVLVKKIKVEKGNRATDWSPAPEDQEILIEALSNYTNSIRTWYAVCSTAAATAAKIATIDPVTSDFTTSILKPSTVVFVKFTTTNTAAVADLTLNINSTGAKPIKQVRNGTVQNLPGVGYLAANATYQFTYDGANWLYTGNYDSNSNDNARYVQFYNTIVAGETLHAASIIGGRTDGKFYQVKENSSFDLSSPLLWLTTDLNEGVTDYSHIYTQCYDRNLATYYTSFVNTTANKIVYLVGTVNGNTFSIYGANSNSYLTVTPPTQEDGRFYIPIGRLGNQSSGKNYFNYQVAVPVSLYAFIDGKFRQVTPTEIVATQKIYYRSKVSGNVPVPNPKTWITSKSDIYNDTISAGVSGWSTKITPLSKDKTSNTAANKYLYLYTCEQRKRLDGTVEYIPADNALLDDSTTVIDGGNIITGTVTANQLNAANINASHILTVGSMTTDTQTSILNDKLSVGSRNLLIGSMDISTVDGEFGWTSNGNLVEQPKKVYLAGVGDCIYFKKNTTSDKYVPSIATRNIALVEWDKEYVYGIDIKFDKAITVAGSVPNHYHAGSNSNGGYFNVGVNRSADIASNVNNISNGTVIPANTWVHYEHRFKWKAAPSDSAYPYAAFRPFVYGTVLNEAAGGVQGWMRNPYLIEANSFDKTTWSPAPEEQPKKNLSPFFSFEPYNTTAGQGGQYWQAFTYPNNIVPLGDGWARITTRDNTSGSSITYDQHRPKTIPALKPDSTYTLLVEIKNVTKTGNVYLRCPDGGQTLNDASVIFVNGYNTTIDLPVVNGVFHKVFRTGPSTQTSYDVFFGMCTRIDASSKATYDIRISLYEGVYFGPYQQYDGMTIQQEQRIYYRSNSTTAPTAPTVFVTSTADANVTWTTRRIKYDKDYKYMYTTMQRKRLDGTVSCDPVLLDDTTTIIDGGNIITGSVKANAINAESGTFNTANIPNLSAAKITSGDIVADRIKTNVVNAINATVNKIDAKNINVNAINIGDLSGTVGGKNLALDSDQPYNWQKYTPTTYEIAQIKMTEDFIPGETYTVTIWGGPITRSDKSSCWYALYWGGGNFSLANTTLIETGVYRATFTISTTSTAQHTAAGNNILDIYNTPAVGASGTTYSAPITKIQIEKGNIGTEWEPAQEELPRPNLYKTTTTMAYIVGSGSSASGTITAHDDSYHGRTLTVTTAGGTLRISNIIPKTNIPYTVSFILTASVATTISVDIMDNTVKTITVPKGTSKVIFTSTPTRAVDSTYHFIDMVFNTAGTYKMENIKVEMGTVATTWIEAEQISNYIHADSTGINIYDNRLSNANKYYLRQTAGGTYIYRNTYLKAKYEDTITLYGGSSASGANPRTEFSSTALKFIDANGKNRLWIDASAADFYDTNGKLGTRVNTDGLTIYKAGSKRAQTTTNGLDIFGSDGSTSIASFGSTARVGTTATGRVEVTSTGVGLYNKNNKMKVSIGTGNSIFYGGEGTYPYIEVSTSSTGAIDIKQSANAYTSITSSGMEIFANINSTKTSVANFGTTARIGATNGAAFIIDSKKLQAYYMKDNTTRTKYFEVSPTSMTYGNYTVANTGDVTTAGNTANLFITPVNDNEIKLHSKTGKASNNYAKVNSDGLWVYKQNNLVAKFSDSITLGREGYTRVEVNFNSFKMLDRNGNKYCHISDLRNESGSVYLEEEFVVPNSGKVWPKFEYSHAFNDDVIIYLGQVSYRYSDGIIIYEGTSDMVGGSSKRPIIALSTTAIPVGSTITVKYRATDDRLKGYTFGIRDETETKIGGLSFSEGYGTSAIGNYSHSEGADTRAEKEASHAEGLLTVASGNGSHAEGFRSVASGEFSHAEGGSHFESWSVASGFSSHAECVSEASGNYSHAENYSTASGECSHAENDGTASGEHSHAENKGKATGNYSHAEGSGKASGNYSHAENSGTAIGESSHASGKGTIANYSGQFVCGIYNSNQSNSLFEVGNGTSSTRSNALTLDTSGNLTISGNITTNKDLTFGNGTTATLIAKTPSRTAGILWIGGGKKTAGDANGTVVRLQGGGLMLVGGGEYPNNRYNLADLTDGTENLYLGADGTVYVETNANTIANRKTFTFGTDGTFNSPSTIKQNGVAVSLSGTSLYENTSGKFSGAIPLSETAANFTFIEIYCKDNDGRYCYTKVWNPNGKTVNVTQTLSYGGNFYVKSKAYTISGTSMDTANTSGTYHTGEVNAAGNNSGSTVDNLGVVKVIGYK